MQLLFKDQCHVLITKGSASPEPENTRPSAPVKVFVIISNDITLLSDIGNVIVFMFK